MNREERRRRTGRWLLGLLGLLFAIIGIRYASSQEWWSNAFNSDKQAYQTVNTGVSVQVSNSASPVPIVPDTIVKPSPTSKPISEEDLSARRRMW